MTSTLPEVGYESVARVGARNALLLRVQEAPLSQIQYKCMVRQGGCGFITPHATALSKSAFHQPQGGCTPILAPSNFEKSNQFASQSLIGTEVRPY